MTYKIDEKDKKIIEDAIRENIPIFVLIVKDINSIFAIEEYQKECEITGCNLSFCNDVNQRLNEFQN